MRQTLRWNGRHSVCGRFIIQTEQVRGEPVLYILEALTVEGKAILNQSSRIDPAHYGRGGVAIVKQRAQAIIDWICERLDLWAAVLTINNLLISCQSLSHHLVHLIPLSS